jgi:hypothetical protein
MKSKMVKNKSKLAIKLFIIVWVVLAVHIALKLTFNYWQPYVISNDKLQAISDFIDANRWIRDILDCILFLINSVLMVLSAIQQWKFKTKKIFLITILLYIVLFVLNITLQLNTLTIIIGCFIYPLILNKKKWLTTIIAFILSFVFLALSLWLEGFINSNDMQYICKVFLQFDYYIMLVLNYFVFNLIRKKE